MKIYVAYAKQRTVEAKVDLVAGQMIQYSLREFRKEGREGVGGQ